jgi:hypothetical protein
VTDLKDEFGRKQWKSCCGKGCKKCEIAQAYIGEYGRKDGLEKLNDDRKAVLKGDGKKKAGGKKKGGAKKRGGGKKKGAKKKAKA